MGLHRSRRRPAQHHLAARQRGTGQGPLHWTASFDEIQDFEHDIRNAFGGTGFLSDDAFNSGTRNQTLGDPKAGASPELDALAAYLESLDRVPASPHRDPDGTLTEDGWSGHALFESAGCLACHGGPDFTDSAQGTRYDVGTLSATSGQRLGEALDGLDTPTLRGIWQTAPYLHDGSAATLEEAIASPDDRHGRTQQLSADERAQLIAYLLQIDNTPYKDERELPAPAADAGGVEPADAAAMPDGDAGPRDAGMTMAGAPNENSSGCTASRLPSTRSGTSWIALAICAGAAADARTLAREVRTRAETEAREPSGNRRVRSIGAGQRVDDDPNAGHALDRGREQIAGRATARRVVARLLQEARRSGRSRRALFTPA